MKTITMLMGVCAATILTGCGDTYYNIVGSGGSGGGGGSGATSSTSGVGPVSSATGTTMCGAGEKACGAECKSVDDSATGCGAESCDPCATPHAVATCANQQCAVSQCIGNWNDCDGAQGNGCESDSESDSYNCGACGHKCAAPNSQIGVCAGGECAIGPCDAGHANCDGSIANGCETDTTADVNNCNGCMMECAAGLGCAASSCHSCGHEFNYASGSNVQIPSGMFIAFRYVPKYSEHVTQLCVKGEAAGTTHTLYILNDNGGPTNVIGGAPAIVTAGAPPGVLCTYSALAFAAADLVAGKSYWIATTTIPTYGDSAGEQVDAYSSNSATINSQSVWFKLPGTVGAIAKVSADCK